MMGKNEQIRMFYDLLIVVLHVKLEVVRLYSFSFDPGSLYVDVRQGRGTLAAIFVKASEKSEIKF